ncbi:hypothetical protein A5741_05645 [Mycolicibacterium conceptionense]|nr:hypothetical protein [Mycolicibacterium conceptionense]OMB72833.1 hypothetical protein A5741_05645 [Mycolicibacterium conceptionense]
MRCVEPGIDIEVFDSEHGWNESEGLQQPLKDAHELASLCLRGAGETLFASASVLNSPSQWAVSPAVLARATAVYSAKAFRLSDPGLSAWDRCSLSLHFWKTGVANKAHGHMNSETDEIQRWIDTHGLKKPKQTSQEDQLVASMYVEEERNSKKVHGRRLRFLEDDNFYARLSNLAHANPVNLSIAVKSPDSIPEYAKVRVLFDAMFGLYCGYKAAQRINELRGGPTEPLDEMYDSIVTLVDAGRIARESVDLKYNRRFHW